MLGLTKVLITHQLSDLSRIESSLELPLTALGDE